MELSSHSWPLMVYLLPRERAAFHASSGGRAAEMAAFAEVTTGAADDFDKVTNIAHNRLLPHKRGTKLGSADLSESQN
jgi:ATP-dependent Zn protease